MTIAFPSPGSVLAGRYVLQGVLGRGRSGQVHLAAQPALAREVAIKVVCADAAPLLAREAIAAARVRHAGSVIVHDVGVGPGGAGYLVMERVRGRPLAELVAAGPLPLAGALGITEQILGVLEVAHACGVVHGDLTGADLLVEETALGDRVVLFDYGPAVCDAADARPGVAADIRAAGVLLYQMLTGDMPSERAELELPPALDYVVTRALEPDLKRRFPTAQAMRRSLGALDRTRMPRPYHGPIPLAG